MSLLFVPVRAGPFAAISKATAPTTRAAQRGQKKKRQSVDLYQDYSAGSLETQALGLAGLPIISGSIWWSFNQHNSYGTARVASGIIARSCHKHTTCTQERMNSGSDCNCALLYASEQSIQLGIRMFRVKMSIHCISSTITKQCVQKQLQHIPTQSKD